MSGFQKLELDFLWEVSNVLTKNCTEEVFLSSLENVFEKYFNLRSLQISLWDERTSNLRDFVREWIFVGKNRQQQQFEKIYITMQTAPEKSFILNNKILSFASLKDLVKNFSKYLRPENNLLYFPIINEKKIAGLIELNFDDVIEQIKTQDFLVALGISAAQISAAVMNRVLNRKMLINISFQSVMKNIAKLIETQYDLAYILPIIGEMVDKFVADHLIYIFMKDENGEFRLVWPANCNDEKIYSLFEKLTVEKPYGISPDGKTGVWAIRNEQDVIGAIAASSTSEKLCTKDIEYLALLTRQASITIERANSYAQVLQYATLDALTGLNNRRQFESRLNQEVATAKRKKKPLCCIMLDIDHFKKVNDTYGHAAGDCVLKNVAGVIQREVREYDIASRYGGEEFCILLPDTNLEEAEYVAKRLRSAVEKTDIEVPDLGVLNVTISVGVSRYEKDYENPEILHQKADIALYEAKRGGRNRVVVYNSDMG